MYVLQSSGREKLKLQPLSPQESLNPSPVRKPNKGVTDITRRPRFYRPVAAFELTGSVLVSPKEKLSTSSLLACLILSTLAHARVVLS